jgi:hypothetical protein
MRRRRYTPTMPKRSSKTPDVNMIAKMIADRATSNTEAPPADNQTKNQAAVALGRLGGLKGGKARAKSLTKKKRSEIAKRAAKARWSKQEDK